MLAVVVIAEEFDPSVRGWGIGAFAAIESSGAGLAALLFALVGGIETWMAWTLSGWLGSTLANCAVASHLTRDRTIR